MCVYHLVAFFYFIITSKFTDKRRSTYFTKAVYAVYDMRTQCSRSVFRLLKLLYFSYSEIRHWWYECTCTNSCMSTLFFNLNLCG